MHRHGRRAGLAQVASEAELEALLLSGLEACEAQRLRTGREPPPGGKDRFSVSDPLAFDSEVVLGCEELLLRVLDRVDEQLPSVYESLLSCLPRGGWPASHSPHSGSRPPRRRLTTCKTRDPHGASSTWRASSSGPRGRASDQYMCTKQVATARDHKDHLALTFILPHTRPTQRFLGGGTGFWSALWGAFAQNTLIEGPAGAR